jgi:hypothetical protein
MRLLRSAAAPIAIAAAVAAFTATSPGEEGSWTALLEQARTHLRGERPAESIAAIRKAFASGLDDVSLVLSDAALLPLHRDPGFKALIRDHAGTRPIVLVTPEEPGEPLEVTGELRSADGKAVAGALIHVFHADATGWYSRLGAMDEPRARIFGYLRSDAEGRFVFRTIRPGAYPERADVEGPARYIPAHIHVEVEAPGGGSAKLQVVFSDDPRMQPEHWKAWAASHRFPVVEPSRGGDGLWRCLLPIGI